MRRRRLLILTGFVLALAAMLPATALAGAWAVVCTNVDGQSHIEWAHVGTGCSHPVVHADCIAPDHDHGERPCDDRSLEADHLRLPDKPIDLTPFAVPVADLVFSVDFGVGPAGDRSISDFAVRARPGPPPGLSTTILRL